MKRSDRRTGPRPRKDRERRREGKGKREEKEKGGKEREKRNSVTDSECVIYLFWFSTN